MPTLMAGKSLSLHLTVCCPIAIYKAPLYTLLPAPECVHIVRAKPQPCMYTAMHSIINLHTLHTIDTKINLISMGLSKALEFWQI